MPHFADDPDIRAYAASAIKELEALKKRWENRSTAPKAPTGPIRQSDIASLQEAQVESIGPIRRPRSARTIPDDESDDELRRSDYDITKPTDKPSEQGDTRMTTNLEDSTWAHSQ